MFTPALRTLLPALLLATACGPDLPRNTLDVDVTIDGSDVVFSWTSGPGAETVPTEQAGTVAVYPCGASACPTGAYRDTAAGSPAWYLVREDLTECTFPVIDPGVRYGEVLRPADTGPGVDAAPLVSGQRYIVYVYRYRGCLLGGPLDAGWKEFVAP